MSIPCTSRCISTFHLLAVSFLLVLLPGSANAQTLYWTSVSDRTLSSLDLGTPGAARQVLLDDLSQPTNVAVRNGVVYISSYGGTIKRFFVQSGVLEDVVTGLGAVVGLALDTDCGRLYWATADKVQFASLSSLPLGPGDMPTDVASGLTGPRGLAFDEQDRLFILESNGTVRSVDLSGCATTGPLQTFGSHDSGPLGITIDACGGKLYWAVQGDDDWVVRADLDGGSAPEIYFPTMEPQYVAFNSFSRDLYWTELGSGPGFGSIKRRNVDDGTPVQVVVGGLSGLGGLAFDIIEPAVSISPAESVVLDSQTLSLAFAVEGDGNAQWQDITINGISILNTLLNRGVSGVLSGCPAGISLRAEFPARAVLDRLGAGPHTLTASVLSQGATVSTSTQIRILSVIEN